MEDTIQKENKIVTGVIWQQLLLFFFPILFGTFFQQLYNAADAVIVGRFVVKEALSAVGGGTGTLIQLLVGFFVGLSSGATVIISQYYGAKRAEMVGYAVHTSAYAPTNAIAFGDYKYYNIGDRGTRSFKQLNELFAGNGMIGMVAKERVDGKLVLPEAVQILKLKSDAQAGKA